MTQTMLLVADDQEDNLAIFSAILTHHGYGVVRATHGREAVELARTHVPRLILMDLHMPVLDGWGAIRLLKADPETADIPVVAVTAEDHARSRLQQAGFCAYVRKPVAPENLVRAVRLCLEGAEERTRWIVLPSFESGPSRL